MKKTIKEISEIVSAAPSTVSLALRDSPKVKKETKARIRKIAQMMGYRPSMVARSLVTGKTFTIGLIIPAVTEPFYAELVEEVQKQFHLKSYLTLVLSANTLDEEKEAVKTFLSRGVDGLICHDIRYEEIVVLREEGIPFVLYSNPVYEVDYVAVDRYKGAYMAVEHLIRLEYEKIAFLGMGEPQIEKRFMAYQDALRHHNLPIRNEWMMPRYGYYATGYEGMKKLLLLSEKPQAVFCLDDVAAIGAMKAVWELGLKIPDDMAIVGFDNIKEGEYVCPPLTTVDQPKAEIVRKLVEVLLTKIENKNGYPLQQITIEPKLIIRKSCGYCLREEENEKMQNAGLDENNKLH
jgi:DNA-binding LacI/PurR family transcriptional regulator